MKVHLITYEETDVSTGKTHFGNDLTKDIPPLWLLIFRKANPGKRIALVGSSEYNLSAKHYERFNEEIGTGYGEKKRKDLMKEIDDKLQKIEENERLEQIDQDAKKHEEAKKAPGYTPAATIKSTKSDVSELPNYAKIPDKKDVLAGNPADLAKNIGQGPR